MRGRKNGGKEWKDNGQPLPVAGTLLPIDEGTSNECFRKQSPVNMRSGPARRGPAPFNESGTACTPDSVHPCGLEDHFSQRLPGGREGASSLLTRAASSAQLPCSRRGLPMRGALRRLPVGSYPTFSPLPFRAVTFCGTVHDRGMWPSIPRLSTGVALIGVRKFLQALRLSGPPAVPEIYCAVAGTSSSGL